MSKNVLLSKEDVACLIGAHPKLRNFVNSRYRALVGKVDKAINVPLIERDSLYYAHLTFLRGDICGFKSNIDFLQQCSVITALKCIEIRDKCDALLDRLEKDGVYA